MGDRAMQLAERLHRPDLQSHALAWLARAQQAKGDLDGAIAMDRQTLVLAPGVTTATHMLGPLSRSSPAVRRKRWRLRRTGHRPHVCRATPRSS